MTETDDVLAIADGRDRADIEIRAGNAFSRANDLRATAGLATRMEAINRAAAWVDVLRHLDRTGDTLFDVGQYGTPQWSLASLFGTLGSIRLLFGRKPFTFYTF